MSKITLATFKKFIRENEAKLFINVESDFDGMTDCVQACKGGFKKLEKEDERKEYPFKPYNMNASGVSENTLGFKGVWLVGSSRDYFSAYEEGVFVGIRVLNSCGSYIVAKQKED